MSAQSGHAGFGPALIGTPATAAPAHSSWSTWIERLCKALRHRRQLRDLVELDDRLLADIGVTREQALREAARPYWALVMA